MLLAGLVDFSCSATKSPEKSIEPQACALPAEWEITLTRSGGFAGLSQLVFISSRGTLLVQDLPKGETRESTILQDEVAKISEMLSGACPFEIPQRAGRCPDCLEYDLSIIMDGRLYRVKFNEINITDNLLLLTSQMESYIAR
jgi:hypothetical protein